MTHEQIIAIEKFARNYRDTIANSSVNKDEFGRHAIAYALKVLDIHLDLARVAFNQSADEEAQYHGIR